MKRIILGMAKDKKSTLASLEAKTPELMDTLIKLYLYPDHESVNHWRQEVAAFINSTPRLKSNNKFPKAKDILKNTWYIWEDCLLDHINPIMEDYGDVKYHINKNDLYYSCQKYFEWLANQLAANGLVSKKSIYEILNDLGF